MTEKRMRAILIAEYGNRKYRIQKDGYIYVYGKMPNTNKDGWYLFGFVGDWQTEQRIEEIG